MFHLTAMLPLLAPVNPAMANEPPDAAPSEVVVRGTPLTVTRKLELQAGLYRVPYGGMALPMSGSFLIDATTARRDMSGMADLTLGADPLGPDAVAALRGLEVYRRDDQHPLDFRVGRLCLGQHEVPEGQLWQVATQQVTRGHPRRPAPERDRFLFCYFARLLIDSVDAVGGDISGYVRPE